MSPLYLLLLLNFIYTTRAVTNEELKDILENSQATLQNEMQEIKNKLDHYEEEREQIFKHLAALLQDVQSLVAYHEETEPKQMLQADKLEKSLAILLKKFDSVETTVKPTTTTVKPTTAPVPRRGGVCGSIATQDSRHRAPSGWTLCYITKAQHKNNSGTVCKDLIQDLIQPGKGKSYANYQQLLSAGGNFGCWRGSEGMSSRIQSACQKYYQHEGRLSSCNHCDILGVCIRYPS